RFDEAPAPTFAELESVARRVHRRVTTWLRRKGHLEERARDPSPLEACAAIALRRGTVRKLGDDGRAIEHDEPRAPEAREPRAAVDVEGFNLEASGRIDADDDVGRERLFRYGARPPIALGRLRWIAGGRVAYRIKKLRDGKS